VPHHFFMAFEAAFSDIKGLSGWKQRAACKGSAPNTFYPETDAEVNVAKAVCARCPVRSICLDTAIRNRERHGVWGGMTAAERDRLRRSLRPAA
jgi:WhiB family redox-sensing transcriptional regulator